MPNLKRYKNIIFDCDGVILNSNTVKTDGFLFIGSLYCSQAADLFVDYHIKNGGISRYVKIRYFLNVILPSLGMKPIHSEEELCNMYSQFINSTLLKCEVSPCLKELKSIAESPWLVVSGSDQLELRSLFTQLDISCLFDGGIYGSPKNKYQIVTDLTEKFNLSQATLFIGDSEYDYEVSSYFGFEFILLSAWSDMQDCSSFAREHGVMHFPDLRSLC